MSIPLRVNDTLFKEAEAEGSLMKRSAAKQVEFWAELGKQIAHLVSPTDMLVLMQGLAKVQIDLPNFKPINASQVFAAVDEVNSAEQLGSAITRSTLYYEASLSRPGLLDQVMPDGSRQTGHFQDGKFSPE